MTDYKQVEVSGTVSRRMINAGSKSEHSAVMLDTAAGDSYELRLPGGNPFEPSGDLAGLVGKQILTRGVASDGTLLMQEWHPADSSADENPVKSGK